NPYHLGIVFLLNLEIGYLMPPMGLNLFIAGFRFNRPVPDLYRVVLPFIGIFTVALLITTYVPGLTVAEAAESIHPPPAASVTEPPRDATLPTGSPAPPPSGSAPVAPAASGAAPADCEEPRDGEAFADFDKRCNVTGASAPAASGSAAPAGSGSAAPATSAAPADCEAPRPEESFADFDKRCKITGG
ncbi:MAG TPA: TRAP transporter large permease subunit, partial [Polyangiaceae bacterium]|nr:TRAP transporter large permease subunit [Polyangiaceae bacterium]